MGTTNGNTVTRDADSPRSPLQIPPRQGGSVETRGSVTERRTPSDRGVDVGAPGNAGDAPQKPVQGRLVSLNGLADIQHTAPYGVRKGDGCQGSESNGCRGRGSSRHRTTKG